jgi:hypothetical protein
MAKSAQAQFRDGRLDALKAALKSYYTTEKVRLTNEATVLNAVLSGRTAGAGIQKSSTEIVSKVAESDLAAYLRGS